MGLLSQAADLFLRLDVHLEAIIASYGALTYLLLFLVVFCETGLVVMPFLPGDSLLFAAGAFAARGSLSFGFLFLLLAAAAVAGDAVNYAAGATVGPRFFRDTLHLLKQEHLDRTRRFFEAYGGKAVVFARFVPIVRTVAPFTAGVGKMTYARFALFNVAGGILWVALFLGGGYLFGNIPAVEKNFSAVILGIIVLSLVPPLVEAVRAKLTTAKK